MEALYTTHDELFHLLGLRNYPLGQNMERLQSSGVLEMAEILLAFHRSVRTGQWQAHLPASKKEKKNSNKVFCI